MNTKKTAKRLLVLFMTVLMVLPGYSALAFGAAGEEPVDAPSAAAVAEEQEAPPEDMPEEEPADEPAPAVPVDEPAPSGTSAGQAADEAVPADQTAPAEATAPAQDVFPAAGAAQDNGDTPAAAPAADPVMVTPVFRIQAIYEATSGPPSPEGEPLPEGKTFKAHIEIVPVGGGTTYTFERTITKTYEEFLGTQAIPTGDYMMTITVGEGLDGEEWIFIGEAQGGPEEWPMTLNASSDNRGEWSPTGYDYPGIAFPYVYKGGTVTLDINTVLADKKADAFTGNELLYAELLSEQGSHLAGGTAEVSGEGMTSLLMMPSGGGAITKGDGTQYRLRYFTRDRENGTEDTYWSYREVPVTIDEDGKIVLGDGVENRSCLFNRKYDFAAPAVSQDGGDSDQKMQLVTDVSQFQTDGYYMIVVHNEKDGKWYALSANDQGFAVELTDFTGVEDVWKVKKSTMKNSPYIFKASKVVNGDGSTSLGLSTKDADGNSTKLRLGNSKTDMGMDTVFSTSGGTLVLTAAEGNQYTITKSNYAQLRYVPELFGSSYFFNSRTPLFVRPAVWRYNSYGSYNEIDGYYQFTTSGSDYDGTTIAYAIKKPSGSYSPYSYRYPNTNNADLNGLNEVYGVGSREENDAYWENGGQAYLEELTGRGDLTVDKFYLLTDQEVDEDYTLDKDYTLIKSFADMITTLQAGENKLTSFVLATESGGKTYALCADGLIDASVKSGGDGYNVLTTSQKAELRTGGTMGISGTPFSGPGFVTDTTFENGVPNLKLKDGAFEFSTGKEQGSAYYVFVPTSVVNSEAQALQPTSYYLAAMNDSGPDSIRFVGVSDGQMTTVSSQSEAAVFKIYSQTVSKYESDSTRTKVDRYYEILNLSDLKENDEILIVAEAADGTRRIMTNYAYDYGYQSDYYWYSRYPGLVVSDAEDTVTAEGLPASQARFIYNTRADSPDKKTYAWYDSDSDNIIHAQNAAALSLGQIKSMKPTVAKFSGAESHAIKDWSGMPRFLYIKNSDGSYYRSPKEFSVYLEDGKFYLRGGGDSYWLGASSYTSGYEIDDAGDPLTMTGFGSVSKADRVPVKIYRRIEGETITLTYYEGDKETVNSRSILPTGTATLIKLPDEEKDGTTYTFVGWTKDPDKAGYLSVEESANIYDYDSSQKEAYVKPEIREKYGILGKGNSELYDEVEISEDTSLYPVFAVRGFDTVVTADEEDGTMILGIADFKPAQADTSEKPEQERWLGSINIEVYKDGELWVPMKETSVATTSEEEAAGAPAADGEQTTATMYFMYHNDDAADLNIKFILDSITEETLPAYLANEDFSAPEPTDNYVINAVYAEQGGSEDGLKYKYNWVSETGGQLDNVKGGSTVRVYVTTKYQVKYYLDAQNEDGSTYEELTGEAYQDDGFYATQGTRNAVAEAESGTDYAIAPDEEDAELADLIKATPDSASAFADDNMKRGDYSKFLYKLSDDPDTFNVPALPDAPEGRVIKESEWQILDADLAKVGSQAPSSRFTVTGTTYGTGNTGMAYEGEDLGDVTKTYHLYLTTKPEKEDAVPQTTVTITKIWEDADDQDGLRPDAEAFAEHLHLMNGDEEVTGYEPEITVNGDGSFTIKYEGLPESADGEPIVYTVKEDAVEGYTAKDDKTTAEDGGEIVNVHQPDDNPPDDNPPDDNPPDDGGSVTPPDDGGKVPPKSEDSAPVPAKPRTGDPFTMTPYVLAALAALIILALLFVTGRRKQRGKQ